SLIHRRLLLADLAGGFRLILQFLLTALHALAHPIAHASCVTQQTNHVQAKELCPPTSSPEWPAPFARVRRWDDSSVSNRCAHFAPVDEKVCMIESSLTETSAVQNQQS